MVGFSLYRRYTVVIQGTSLSQINDFVNHARANMDLHGTTESLSSENYFIISNLTKEQYEILHYLFNRYPPEKKVGMILVGGD